MSIIPDILHNNRKTTQIFTFFEFLAEKSLQINSIKKNEVVHQSKKKERKALTKSAIFPESQTSQSSLSPSTPQKSLSLTNLNGETSPTVHMRENGFVESTDPITVSTTFSLPSNGTSVAISDTEYRKATQEHNGVVTEKVAVVTNNHLYSTDHHARNEQHSQSILKKVLTYDEEGTLTNGAEYKSNSEISYLKPTSPYKTFAKENGSNDDQSTLIFMTQHSSRSSSFDKSMETDDINFTKRVPLDFNKLQENYNDTTDENFNIHFVPKNTPDDDVDYFKINVVKHDLTRVYSQSEDEHSQEEEEEPRFTRMGYSSQAASIFFGEGEENEVPRPRRIQLIEDDDDERRSSGADC